MLQLLGNWPVDVGNPEVALVHVVEGNSEEVTLEPSAIIGEKS